MMMQVPLLSLLLTAVPVLLLASVIAVVVLGVLARRRRWQLRKRLWVWFLKKVGLYDEQVGIVENRRLEKVRKWQSFKENIVALPILGILLTIILLAPFLLVFLHLLVTAIAVTVVVVVVVAVLIYFKYLARYTQREGWGFTVATRDKRLFIDDICIAKVDELFPDDIRIKRAQAVIKDILAEQAKRRATERQDNGGNDTQTPASPQPTPASTAPTVLPCRVCGVSPANSQKHCASCGAALYPEERYFLVTKAFCGAEDPWYQFLIVSDCDLDLHRRPLARAHYASRVPVQKPVSELSFVEVGVIAKATPVTTGGGAPAQPADLSAAVGPVMSCLMVVDSAEYARRVLHMGRGHPFSQEGFATAGRTYDAYLAIEAADIVDILYRRLLTSKETATFSKEDAMRTAMDIVRDYKLSKRQDESRTAKLSQQAKRVGKWLIILAVVAVVGFVFLRFVLPWLLWRLSYMPPSASTATNSTLSHLSAILSGVT